VDARKTSPALPLLLAVTAVVYSNTITSTFQWDDFQLFQNPIVRDPALFLNPLAAFRAGGADALARFVAYASFGLDLLFWGPNARGFHATNLLVHLAAVALVYALVGELFKTPRLAGSRLAADAPWIAVAAAALFALHPLQTQAVSYVVQRMTSLAVALGLLGLVSWLRARRARDGRAGGWLALATAAMAAAMMTKEIAFTFPALAVLAELAFFRGPARRRVLLLAPIVATMAIVPAITLAGEAVAERLQAGGEATLGQMGLGRPEYLITQAHVVVTYLRMLAWPAGQNLFPDYPTTRALDAGTAAAIALHAALVVGAVWIGWRSRERAPERTLAAFGVLWFYVALSVETLAVVIMDVMNEHRVYYPSVGAFLAVATVGALAARALGRRARIALVTVAALALVALGAATHARNVLWGDEVAMWSDVAAKSPKLSSAHRMLGFVMLRQGRFAEAVAPLRQAIDLTPYYPDAWMDLASAYLGAGEAARTAHARAALRYVRLDVTGALAEWDVAVRLAPGDGAIHHGRALALRALGRQQQATEELGIACRLGVARACGGGGMVPDP
jgi:Tfp pilus assembly protein PilF